MIAPEFRALREVCASDDIKALRERNEQRAAEARYKLGRGWLCHPDNRVRPQPQERGILRMTRNSPEADK